MIRAADPDHRDLGRQLVDVGRKKFDAHSIISLAPPRTGSGTLDPCDAPRARTTLVETDLPVVFL
jgi:hypothetical protein